MPSCAQFAFLQRRNRCVILVDCENLQLHHDSDVATLHASNSFLRAHLVDILCTKGAFRYLRTEIHPFFAALLNPLHVRTAASNIPSEFPFHCEHCVSPVRPETCCLIPNPGFPVPGSHSPHHGYRILPSPVALPIVLPYSSAMSLRLYQIHLREPLPPRPPPSRSCRSPLPTSSHRSPILQTPHHPPHRTVY